MKRAAMVVMVLGLASFVLASQSAPPAQSSPAAPAGATQPAPPPAAPAAKRPPQAKTQPEFDAYFRADVASTVKLAKDAGIPQTDF